MKPSAGRAIAAVAELSAHPDIAPEFSSNIASAIRAAIPFDGWCLFGVDPLTGLRTVQFGQNGTEGTAWMAQNEAVMHDVNNYRDLAAAAYPAGWLSRSHQAARTSPRLNEILLPQGYSSELRLVLKSRGLVWGALVLFRSKPGPGFTDDDAAEICHLGEPLAQAIRTYTARSTLTPGATLPAGVINVDAADRLSVSSEAQTWIDDLVPGGDDETYARDVTRVVFEAAHALRRGRGNDAVCTVRTVSGRWMRLEAIAQPDDSDNVTVVLHDATASQRAGALAAYFQLTGRERQVVDQLYAGRAANQIGRKLGISTFTVNEHLRAIYRKSGSRSRQELLARLN